MIVHQPESEEAGDEVDYDDQDGSEDNRNSEGCDGIWVKCINS